MDSLTALDVYQRKDGTEAVVHLADSFSQARVLILQMYG